MSSQQPTTPPPGSGAPDVGAPSGPLTTQLPPDTSAPTTDTDSAPAGEVDLNDLLGAPGPVLSMYATVSGDLELVATKAEESLAGMADITEAQRRFAIEAFGTVGDDDALLAILVGSEGTGVSQTGPDPMVHNIVHVAPLPLLSPLLEMRQMLIPHLMAHQAGEVWLLSVHQPGTTPVPAGEVPIEDGAETVAQLAASEGCEAIALVGEPAQTGRFGILLRNAGLDVTIRLLEVPDSNDVDSVASELVAQLASVAAERTVAALQTWRFERSHERSVDGLADVVHALAQGRVQRLLLHDDPADQHQLWFGTSGTELALDLEHATQNGMAGSLSSARAGDVLMRSALLQHAEISLLPANLADGPDGLVGAILR